MSVKNPLVSLETADIVRGEQVPESKITVTLDARGRITLPKFILKELGTAEGGLFTFARLEDQIFFRPSPRPRKERGKKKRRT